MVEISHCEYFSQLFDAEKGISEMEIKEFNYVIVENFVKFFYTTCVDEKVRLLFGIPLFI